jgi:hypothetical protein
MSFFTSSSASSSFYSSWALGPFIDVHPKEQTKPSAS